MKTIHIKTVYSIIIAFFMAACTSEQAHDHNESNHDEHDDHAENTITLSPEQFNNTSIETGKLQQAWMPSTIEVNGKIRIPPQNHATITPFMGGIIRSIKVLPGDKVEKGSVLAILEHPDFLKLQENYITNKSDLDYWHSQYERQSRLYADSIGSAREFQETKAKFQGLKARVQSQERQLSMLGVNPSGIEDGDFRSQFYLRSPIRGQVQHIDARIGQYTNPDEPVFEVINQDHIHLDMTIYEKNMSKVKKDQHLTFTLANEPDSPWKPGHIFAINSQVDEERKSLEVHAHAETNDGSLIPGRFIKARIHTDSARQWALPEEGVVDTEEGAVIFKVNATPENDDHYVFEMIRVSAGTTYQGLVGLNNLKITEENPQFVVNDARLLHQEFNKSQIKGHSH